MSTDFDVGPLELVTEGLAFPEGPVALPDGDVLVVEIEGCSVARVSPDGAVKRYPVGLGPNGMALGPDGAAYVCCDGGLHFVTDADGVRFPDNLREGYEGGEIQRLDLATGAVATVFTHVGENRITSLNDIVFDTSGSCYIVDTSRGQLYYADPIGGTIEVAEENLITPNGMGLSPDGKTLYVSETYTGEVYRWDVTAPGRLANKTRHYFVDGEHPPGPLGQPGYDGLAVDGEGNVCIANLTGSGITVVAPDGKKIGALTTPLHDPYVTNICFGGPDVRSAWICSSGRGRLYKVRWPVDGLALNFSGFAKAVTG